MNTLTGFRTENFIVTDEYIHKVKSCDEVVFSFFDVNGYTISHSVKISFEELKKRINPIANHNHEGFSLISVEGLLLEQVPSLLPELSVESHIGTTIAILGFHEDSCNLALKVGTVSSFVKTENGKQQIQFDASIKQGNAGSPVINIETGKIIGVVSYKISGFSKAYDAFRNIIDENLRLLKKSEGKFNIMDIDPIQVLIANQNQLKQMSKEFYKMAMLSYGFAHEVYAFKNYLNSPEKIDSRTWVKKV